MSWLELLDMLGAAIGNLDQSLGSVTLTAAGAPESIGILSQSLNSITLASSGIVEITGSLNVTLGVLVALHIVGLITMEFDTKQPGIAFATRQPNISFQEN